VISIAGQGYYVKGRYDMYGRVVVPVEGTDTPVEFSLIEFRDCFSSWYRYDETKFRVGYTAYCYGGLGNDEDDGPLGIRNCIDSKFKTSLTQEEVSQIRLYDDEAEIEDEPELAKSKPILVNVRPVKPIKPVST